jgi:hypothetical protein
MSAHGGKLISFAPVAGRAVRGSAKIKSNCGRGLGGKFSASAFRCWLLAAGAAPTDHSVHQQIAAADVRNIAEGTNSAAKIRDSSGRLASQLHHVSISTKNLRGKEKMDKRKQKRSTEEATETETTQTR